MLRTRLGAAVIFMLVTVPALAQQPATPISEQAVHDIAIQLRCVVCQNLSVADSPSEMAAQMRTAIREHLAAGERPDQVVQYFVDKYGEWILLAPRRQGFNLLVWAMPGIALAVGLLVVGILVTRWTRRRPLSATAAPPTAAMRERIRREMERET